MSTLHRCARDSVRSGSTPWPPQEPPRMGGGGKWATELICSVACAAQRAGLVSQSRLPGVFGLKGFYNHSPLQRKEVGIQPERCAQLLSRVRLFVTPWTVAHQALLCVGFSQARILARVAIPSSRGSPRPRD